MRTTTYDGLKVHITGGEDREGGGTGPLVVLLHGFGAPGTDLVALWRQLDVPREVRFAFPEGPLELGAELGAAYGEARAWWMIDIAALQAGAAGADRPDRTNEVPEGLEAVKPRVLDMLTALQDDLNVAEGKLVLGGFSQGAMLATDIALTTDRALAGLVVLSGTLLKKDVWVAAMPSRRGLAVLQSHGRTDALLPFAAAERLRDHFRDAGLSVEWIEFNGGHSLSDSVVEALARFIRNQTS